jgi:hypothetical protein
MSDEPAEASRATRGPGVLGPAPADARPHGHWPPWRTVLAYVVLAALAAGAIWYVDLKAHRPNGNPYPAAPPRDAAAFGELGRVA